MFSSIFGLYPLDANVPLPHYNNEKVSRHCQMSPGWGAGRTIPSRWEPLSQLDLVCYRGHPLCVRQYPAQTEATTPSQRAPAGLVTVDSVFTAVGLQLVSSFHCIRGENFLLKIWSVSLCTKCPLSSPLCAILLNSIHLSRLGDRRTYLFQFLSSWVLCPKIIISQ